MFCLKAKKKRTRLRVDHKTHYSVGIIRIFCLPSWQSKEKASPDQSSLRWHTERQKLLPSQPPSHAECNSVQALITFSMGTVFQIECLPAFPEDRRTNRENKGKKEWKNPDLFFPPVLSHPSHDTFLIWKGKIMSLHLRTINTNRWLVEVTHL